jgi:transposase
MDARILARNLPALDPGALTGLRRLGVDEVARAKGQDYLTIVYDLDSGQLVWVTEGRRKAALTALPRVKPRAWMNCWRPTPTSTPSIA